MAAETILVVDDESSIRAYILKILRLEGFQVLEGADGVDALQVVEHRAVGPDLLLTDVRMPRMDGFSLARQVEQRFPGTPVLYISGFPFNLEEERSTRQSCVCAFLGKPFNRQTLVEAVRKCLRHGPDSGTPG